MKERTRKIFIMIVMAALIVSLMAASFAALTYGRYSGGRRDENSAYEDILDLVGETAFEVSTPDEFVNAVENGYSYIKISEGAEEPFVINNDIADVYTNLVLDVNGTTVIRNSRNPVLDVRRSISVVLVYDSSVEGSGGFYNPVGSALQTSGGSLTVGEGVYESGPNVEGTETLSSTTSSTTATVYKRNGSRPDAEDYVLDGTVTEMPSLSGDVYYTGDTMQYTYIKNDTYLIYTKEENAYESGGQLYVNAKDGSDGNAFNPICNVASCDFYYYYPVEGTPGTTSQPQTYAVVYGYNDVKGLAEDSTDDTTAVDLREKGLAWPYAAIRSVEDPETQEGGVTHARGGAFTTNFGTDNTYGILSVGGEMTVGTESATAPPTFAATGEGTCIGMSAQTGDTLTIASGTFSSEVGDTILMRGGEMTVTGGTFTKTGSHPVPTGNPTATDYAASRTALIHMLGGDLTVNGTVTGESDSRTYSVNMTAGSTDAPLTNVFGIYSTETTDETTGKAVEGTVTISGCKITVNGTYSAGVLSSAGTVNVGGTENGKAETNITVNNSISNNLLTSSAVSSEGGTINLNNTVEIKSDSLGITARGIINVGDETQTAANVTVNTDNATGVYVNNGTLNVKAGATLNVTSTVRSNTQWVQPPEGQTEIPPSIYNGVYVNGGSLNSTGTLNVTHTGVQNESKYNMDISSLGIEWSDLPEIDSRTGKGTRTWEFESDNQSWYDFWEGFNDYRKGNTPDFQEVQQAVSYAVRVEAGGGANTTVTIDSGNITNSVGGGVLVNGGTVTLGETDLEIHAEGDQTISKAYIYSVNRDESGALFWKTYEYTIEVRSAMYFAEIDDPAQNWAYRENQTGGDAVRVEGGELTIEDGEYTSAQGNGIVAVGGKTTINDGTFNGSDKYQVADNNRLVVPAGPAASYAFKVYGGEITVNAGIFGTTGSNASGGFVMGTSAEAPGTAYINGGRFAVSSGKTGGQAGFGVYRYANVTFGQEGTTGNIQVTGLAAGLVLERTPGDSGTTVTINRGTFSSTRIESGTSSDGVWYGNGTSKLNITGESEFTGAGRSGIQLDENPSNNVRITGGTFVANQGYPISGYFSQVVPSEYGIISGSNTWGSSCTIG